MTVRIRYGWVPGRSESLALRADDDGWWRAEVEDQLVGRIAWTQHGTAWRWRRSVD
jgi:hypothetical protein